MEDKVIKNPLVKLGGLTPRDINRARKQIRARGFSRYRLPGGGVVKGSVIETTRFLRWVTAAVELGAGGGTAKAVEGFAALDLSDLSKEDVSKAYWNNRGKFGVFNEDPTSYAMIFQTILQNLRLPPNKASTILDVGAGYGFIPMYLAAILQTTPSLNQTRFITMDNAVELSLRNAEVRLHTRAVHIDGDSAFISRPNLQVICGDMLNIPLPDHSVDQVFSIGSLAWTLNPTRALEEIVRVINPDSLATVHIVLPTMPLAYATQSKGIFLQIPAVDPALMFDFLEERKFSIGMMRQMERVVETSGSRTPLMSRYYVNATFRKEGIKRSWRNRTGKGDIFKWASFKRA